MLGRSCNLIPNTCSIQTSYEVSLTSSSSSHDAYVGESQRHKEEEELRSLLGAGVNRVFVHRTS